MAVNIQLIKWYRKNGRQLPMRETKNPYRTWISEVIFQQTRLEQGLPYYYRFIEQFPTIDDLANASEDMVLKSWQGLGYYSRARNLMETAKFISSNLNGIFPDKYDEIIKLKGIGDYTAAAISSWCFGERKIAIDGNVHRVLSRLYDSEISIKNKKGKQYFQQLGDNLLKNGDPGEINQALIDLGATLCSPRNPQCSECPLQAFCLALTNHTVPLRPVKELKTKTINRYFNYFVFIDNNSTLLQKRVTNDIWKGLYEFPLYETKKPILPFEILSNPIGELILKDKMDVQMKIVEVPKHLLSHQVIYCTFFIIHAAIDSSMSDFVRIDLHEEIEKPLPIVLQKFINKELIY